MGPTFRQEILNIILFSNKKNKSSSCLQNKNKQAIVNGNSLNQIKSTQNPTIFIPTSTAVVCEVTKATNAFKLEEIPMTTFTSTKCVSHPANAMLNRCQSLANKNENNKIKLKRFSSVVECSSSYIVNKRTNSVKFNV